MTSRSMRSRRTTPSCSTTCQAPVGPAAERTPADADRPDELARRPDLPKLPRYLPRPLTIEADRELQRRLDTSEDPRAWALLLMRRTGLHIGELYNLEYHCAL